MLLFSQTARSSLANRFMVESPAGLNSSRGRLSMPFALLLFRCFTDSAISSYVGGGGAVSKAEKGVLLFS